MYVDINTIVSIAGLIATGGWEKLKAIWDRTKYNKEA